MNTDEALAVVVNKRDDVLLLFVGQFEFTRGAGKNDQIEVVQVLSVGSDLSLG